MNILLVVYKKSIIAVVGELYVTLLKMTGEPSALESDPKGS